MVGNGGGKAGESHESEDRTDRHERKTEGDEMELWDGPYTIWIDIWVMAAITVGYWVLSWVQRGKELRSMRRNASKKEHYRSMRLRERRLLVEAATHPVIQNADTIRPSEEHRFLSLRVQNPMEVGTRRN